MKQYVIDELRPKDFERIQDHLKERFGASAMDGVFWIPLDAALYTSVQASHKDCQPFFLAVEMVPPDRMACELLVRTHSRMRCSCIAYATEAQRNWLIDYIDTLLERFAIQT